MPSTVKKLFAFSVIVFTARAGLLSKMTKGKFGEGRHRAEVMQKLRRLAGDATCDDCTRIGESLINEVPEGQQREVLRQLMSGDLSAAGALHAVVPLYACGDCNSANSANSVPYWWTGFITDSSLATMEDKAGIQKQQRASYLKENFGSTSAFCKRGEYCGYSDNDIVLSTNTNGNANKYLSKCAEVGSFGSKHSELYTLVGLQKLQKVEKSKSTPWLFVGYGFNNRPLETLLTCVNNGKPGYDNPCNEKNRIEGKYFFTAELPRFVANNNMQTQLCIFTVHHQLPDGRNTESKATTTAYCESILQALNAHPDVKSGVNEHACQCGMPGGN